MFISLTRLRLRSGRFLPGFAWQTLLSARQLRRSPGFVRGRLLADRRWTFWTLTAWEGPQSMQRYMSAGAHRAAMPKLMHWCDEAAVAHWEQVKDGLPSWMEADRRMRASGRVSKVLHPSPDHAGLSFQTPRTMGSVAL